MTHVRTTISGNVGQWIKNAERNSKIEYIVHIARIYGWKYNGIKNPDEGVEKATEWLTEHVAPEGYYFGFVDNGWGMWKNNEHDVEEFQEKIINSMIEHWLEDQTILRDNLRDFILRSWKEDPDQYKLDCKNYQGAD